MKRIMFFTCIVTFLLTGCNPHKIQEIEMYGEFGDGVVGIYTDEVVIKHDGKNILQYNSNTKQVINKTVDPNIYNPKKELKESKEKFVQYKGIKYEYSFDEKNFIAYINVEIDFTQCSAEGYNEYFNKKILEKENYKINLEDFLDEYEKIGYIIYQ